MTVDINFTIPAAVLYVPAIIVAVTFVWWLANERIFEPKIFKPIRRKEGLGQDRFGSIISKTFWPSVIFGGPVGWAQYLKVCRRVHHYRRTLQLPVDVAPRFREPLDDPGV